MLVPGVAFLGEPFPSHCLALELHFSESAVLGNEAQLRIAVCRAAPCSAVTSVIELLAVGTLGALRWLCLGPGLALQMLESILLLAESSSRGN